MRFVVLLIAVYLAAAADAALVDAMRVGSAAPDLLALAAIVWVLAAGGPRAFLAAGAVMLVGDLVAPGRVGLGAGWMLLAAFGVVQLRGYVKLDHPAVRVAVVLMAVTLWATGVGLTAWLLGEATLPPATIVARAAGVGLYTAAVAVPVLMILGWLREPRRRGRKLQEAA